MWTFTEPDKPSCEFQRKGFRGQRKTRKISHRQIWIASDEFDPEAFGGWDVALWWIAEAFRSTGKCGFTLDIISSIACNIHSFNILLNYLVFCLQTEAIDVDIDEILDMDTDDIRRSHLIVCWNCFYSSIQCY